MKLRLKLLFGVILPTMVVSAQTLSREALIPEPRNVQYTSGQYLLPECLSVSVPEGEEILNTFLAEALQSRWPKLTTKIADTQKAAIRFILSDTGTPDYAEGYRLTVGPGGVEIAARKSAGLFMGLQTLKNLILIAHSPQLPFCQISDWPALKMRGAYLNIGGLNRDGIPCFKRLVDLFAGLKMNLLVLEFGSNLPFEKQKFNRQTLSRSEVADLLAYIRARRIEVVPYLQTLSHVRWLASHPDYISLLEDPKQANDWNNSWCPSNEKVLRIADDVISETISMVKPRYFHIGLDELGLGAYRTCKLCKPKDPAALFAKHVDELTSIVTKHGVTPIVYQDTFAPPELTYSEDKAKGAKALSKLPPGTIVNVWDYNNAPSPALLNFFARKGFPILGATWHVNMGNNQAMPKMVSGLGKQGIGCILTFWHYMPGNITDWKEPGNLTWPGIVLAANYFWNPESVDIEHIDYDPVFEARRRIEPRPAIAATRYTPVPLGKSLNIQFGEGEKTPWYDPEDIRKLQQELSSLPEHFSLAVSENGSACGIMLSGSPEDGLPAKPVEIDLGIKAKGLAFLLTATPARSSLYASGRVRYQPECGALTINYEDGSKEIVPLCYRWNLIDWNFPYGGFHTRAILRNRDKMGRLVQFPVVDWNNPHPEKMIRSVTLSTSRNKGISPFLLSISALGANGTPDSTGILKTALPEAGGNSCRTVSQIDWNAIFRNVHPTMEPGVFTGSPLVRLRNLSDTPFSGTVLELVIPPLKPGHFKGRVYIDIPVKGDSAIKSVELFARCSLPDQVKIDAFYLGSGNLSRYRVQYRLLQGGPFVWSRAAFSFSGMRKEASNDFSANEITTMRLSFWTGNSAPLLIQISPILFLNGEIVPIYRSLSDRVQ